MGLIGLEASVSMTMLFLEPARPTLELPALGRAVLVCNTSPMGVLAPLAFDFLLIGLCTLYALKTRNVPENFNEAKFIGFAMYTTCVIWIAFIPIYFGSNSKVCVFLRSALMGQVLVLYCLELAINQHTHDLSWHRFTALWTLQTGINFDFFSDHNNVYVCHTERYGYSSLPFLPQAVYYSAAARAQ